ncbi:MAG: hypothetical protein LBE20_06310 [Deltaproteobacteria bacterium]|jgi:hypothetical protein|nr:hypothetical protein [Deltaproteobacteria bacterium]
MKSTTNYPNKLNLGCGYDYLQGYLNVDFFNNTVADIKMSATALALPRNYFSEILFKDVIEHFGYCQSFVILADCYLLLKQDGVLVITTPDIEKSFEQYCAAESLEDKENILCHIYGIEDAGMSHKFCFPLSIMEILLWKSGFEVIKKENFEKILFRPNVTITVKKIDTDFFTRRNLLIGKILRSKKIKITYSDFPYFEKIVDDFLKIEDVNDFQNIIETYCRVSPKLLLLLLKEKQDIVNKSKVRDTIQELQGIIEKSDESYFLDFYTKESDFKFAKYKEALRIKNTNYSR